MRGRAGRLGVSAIAAGYRDSRRQIAAPPLAAHAAFGRSARAAAFAPAPAAIIYERHEIFLKDVPHHRITYCSPIASATLRAFFRFPSPPIKCCVSASLIDYDDT